jgi:hypothetical protein
LRREEVRERIYPAFGIRHPAFDLNQEGRKEQRAYSGRGGCVRLIVQGQKGGARTDHDHYDHSSLHHDHRSVYNAVAAEKEI